LRTSWNRYPPYSLSHLEKKLSERLGISRENILIVNGATSFIELFFSKFLAPFEHYIQAKPSYFRYEKLATFYEKKPIFFYNNEGGKYDISNIVNLCQENPNLPLLICNPNNPNGASFDNKDIKIILSATRGTVLLDLTYSWFQPESNITDFSDYLEFENVIQLYSLSKPFGAAGARIGFALLSKAKKEHISYAWNPFPLNHFSYIVLDEILHPKWWQYMLSYVALIKENRTKLQSLLCNLEGIRVLPSQGNFITIDCGNKYHAILDCFNQNNIVVKPLGSNYLRITIGKTDICLKIALLIQQVVASTRN
jgi:histidinol-phosphate aminotransferase